MTTRRSEAEALIVAYRAELVRRSDVIAWADRVIEQEAQPDPAIVEVALASRVDDSELHRRLDAVEGEPDRTEVATLVLSRLADRRSGGTASVGEIVGSLYRLALYDRGTFSENDRSTMFLLKDAFELAEMGYGDVEGVGAQIDAFLSRHLRPQ
jgi:hypothetical protein